MAHLSKTIGTAGALLLFCAVPALVFAQTSARTATPNATEPAPRQLVVEVENGEPIAIAFHRADFSFGRRQSLTVCQDATCDISGTPAPEGRLYGNSSPVLSRTSSGGPGSVSIVFANDVDTASACAALQRIVNGKHFRKATLAMARSSETSTDIVLTESRLTSCGAGRLTIGYAGHSINSKGTGGN